MREGLTLTTRAGERRRADVLGAADRRVVGHALEVIAEPLRDLGQVVRVLQIGVRKRRENAVIQRTERLGIRDLEAVVALEVDRVDRARRRDLIDERRRPGRLRVELEAHAGGAGEPPAHRLDRRLLAEAERVDEAHRLRLQPEHIVQRAAGLAQREVERRGLERPLAKAQRRRPTPAAQATARASRDAHRSRPASTRPRAAAPAGSHAARCRPRGHRDVLARARRRQRRRAARAS